MRKQLLFALKIVSKKGVTTNRSELLSNPSFHVPKRPENIDIYFVIIILNAVKLDIIAFCEVLHRMVTI